MANLKKVMNELKKHRLYVYPPVTLESSWKERVRLYGFPVESLGDLFESEAELENFVHNHKLFRLLDITKVQIEYSPKSTRDRLDMLGVDKSGSWIVLEFKNGSAGKTAVEQVLRYVGMLRQEDPGKPARGILVTGVRNVETAKAIHGMTAEQQKAFEWYLYKYSRTSQTISFHKVTLDFLSRHLVNESKTVR